MRRISEYTTLTVCLTLGVQSTVLPAFLFLLETHQSQFEQLFIKFAQKYGATDREIERAVSLMLGEMLQASGQIKQITLGDFVKSVTNQADSRELTPDGIISLCAESWRIRIKERGARQD